MEPTTTSWIEDGLPATLIPYIGKQIWRAWLIGATLVLKFSDHSLLMAEGEGTDVPGARIVVKITTGDEIGDVGELLEPATNQTPHLRDLRRRKFTGMDGAVLVFDKVYGARLLPDGVQFVKLAN